MKSEYLADETIPLEVIVELKKQGLLIQNIPAKKRGMTDKEVMNYAYLNQYIKL
ncbi:MAG: hypothetical protein GF308_20025 [Candidatus Heimdallarchaeota archaeon]|nr:hypothetical protein [Candidatus Heimdallarchaeota archaeon]